MFCCATIKNGGRELFEREKEQGIDIFSNPDNAYYALGLLSSMRGNKKKANEYWSKIKDKTMLTSLIEDF